MTNTATIPFSPSVMRLAINRDDRSTSFNLNNLKRVSIYSLLFWYTPFTENFFSSIWSWPMVYVYCHQRHFPNAVPCYGRGRGPFLYSGVFFDGLFYRALVLVYFGLDVGNDLFLEVVEVIQLLSGTLDRKSVV